MITAQRTLDIEASQAQVWAVLGRFMHIDEFHPRVTRVEAMSEAPVGVGATRRCHFKDGTSAVERVVDWQEGASYRVQLSEYAMPLNQLFMSLSVAATTPTSSRVTMELRYQVKYGPLGWLLGTTMMASMMGKMMLMVLGGLSERVQGRAPVPAASGVPS
jgi:hypothetical protein